MNTFLNLHLVCGIIDLNHKNFDDYIIMSQFIAHYMSMTCNYFLIGILVLIFLRRWIVDVMNSKCNLTNISQQTMFIWCFLCWRYNVTYVPCTVGQQNPSQKLRIKVFNGLYNIKSFFKFHTLKLRWILRFWAISDLHFCVYATNAWPNNLKHDLSRS